MGEEEGGVGPGKLEEKEEIESAPARSEVELLLKGTAGKVKGDEGVRQAVLVTR